jgi:hypothetical protein
MSAANFRAWVAEDRCTLTPRTGASLFPMAGVVVSGRAFPALSTRSCDGARIAGIRARERPADRILGRFIVGFWPGSSVEAAAAVFLAVIVVTATWPGRRLFVVGNRVGGGGAMVIT